jgi:hypothetical protein
VADPLFKRLPDRLTLVRRAGLQPDRKSIGRSLFDLETSNAAVLFDQGFECERQDGDRSAAGIRQVKHFVVATNDLHPRQRTSAFAPAGQKRDAVAEPVAQNRLHMICKIGEQHIR